MNWLRRLFLATLPSCAPGQQWGVHGEVLNGLGAMGDARLCLRCGLESYDDYGVMFLQCESTRDVKAPEDWPAIEAARALPGGLNNND